MKSHYLTATPGDMHAFRRNPAALAKFREPVRVHLRYSTVIDRMLFVSTTPDGEPFPAPKKQIFTGK